MNSKIGERKIALRHGSHDASHPECEALEWLVH